MYAFFFLVFYDPFWMQPKWFQMKFSIFFTNFFCMFFSNVCTMQVCFFAYLNSNTLSESYEILNERHAHSLSIYIGIDTCV